MFERCEYIEYIILNYKIFIVLNYFWRFLMLLKFHSKSEKLSMLLNLADVQMKEGSSELEIWDMLGDYAVIKCHSPKVAELVINDLYNLGKAEILNGVIEWYSND